MTQEKPMAQEKPMTLPELQLNEADQVRALQESPLVVLSASAGSGKTFSLVTFILGSLGQGSVRPHQVMAMSYTNYSANDLKNRIIGPLEKISTLSEKAWEALRVPLQDENWEAWDDACKTYKIDTEFAYAARQWKTPKGNPDWTQSADLARNYWVSIRREAQLLPVTTIHKAALGIIGLPEKGIIEITHPKLIRFLKSVCRETWKDLPEGLGEEMLSTMSNDWSRLAQIYDSFMDGQGNWSTTWPPLDSLGTTAQQLVQAFNKLVDPELEDAPKRLGRLTEKEKKLDTDFVKILPQLRAIPEETRGRAVLKQIARWNDLFFNDEGSIKDYFAVGHVDLNAFIQALRDFTDLLEQHVAQNLEKALSEFGKKKSRYHWMTYGDIVRQACQDLEKNPLSTPPELLLIDEYQDANPVQDAFLNLLNPKRMIVVGDTKQAIYRFRGGDSTLLRNKIQQAAPKGQAYSLLTNYRSQEPIVTLANFVVCNLFPKILPNYKIYDDKQRAKHPDHHQDVTLGMTLVKPEKNPGFDLTPAFPWITALAKEEGWQKAGYGPVREEANKTKPTRALLIARRTNMPKLMRHLRENGIAAMLRTNKGRLESPGVRLMNALLGFFAEPREPRHLFVLLRSPWIGMTDQDLLIAARLCKDRGYTQGLERLHYLIEKLPTYSDALKWLASLEGQTTARILSEGFMRQSGVLELINALQVFGRLEAERARRNLEEWMTATRQLSDSPAVAYFQIQENYQASDKGDALLDVASVDLIVSTIHQSKGLEFDSVILPLFGTPPNRVPKGSLNEGHDFNTGWSLGNLKGKQLSTVKSETDIKELEDSTNLFYVAITRAKSRLMLIQKARVKSKEEWDGVPENRWEMPGCLNIENSNDWAVLGTEIREEISKGLLDATIFDDCKPPALDPVPRESEEPPEPPDHPCSINDAKKVSDTSTPEEDRARRQGLALHELVRELLLIAPGARAAWLQPYQSIPFYEDVIPQAERCLKKLDEEGWLSLPRRTEYPLEGTAVSLETGFADLVMWEPDRANPKRVIVVDYKRSIPDFKLDDYQKQVRRYMARLQILHPEAQIEGYLYNVQRDTLESVPFADLDI